MRALPTAARALVFSLTLACVAPGALAAPLRCGSVVGERAVLDRDLRCTGVALVLRNPRSVLHLNGHTLASALPCSEGAAPAGIVVEATAEGAQILGPGLVRGFTTGVQVLGTSRARLEDLRVTGTCTHGVGVTGSDRVRMRSLVLHGNAGGALRAEAATALALEASTVFANGGGDGARAAIELRDCDACRVVGNTIVGNGPSGLSLDVESSDAIIERNLVLDHVRADIADAGAANTFALNLFERGDGVTAPRLWPPVARPAGDGAPAIAGCGTLHASVKPRETITLTCPQDPGLRGLRNRIVAYRFLNPLNTDKLMGMQCDPLTVHPASAATGGAVTCGNPQSLWNAVLEVTCCLA